MTTALVWGGVAVLGALAALARFGLDGVVARRVRGDFPWGTTVVNTLGALAAGAVYGAGLDGADQVVLAVGVLGSFTTFSTWMLETHRLAEDGRSAVATLNLLVGAAAGVGAVVLGWALGSLA